MNLEQEQRKSLVVWTCAVGAALIVVCQFVAFFADIFDAGTAAYHLYFLIPVFYVNPLIFVVGSVISFWFGGGIRSAAITAGCYLAAFAVVWEIASNWYGVSWDNIVAGLGTIAVAAVIYAVCAALAVGLSYAVQRFQNRRRRRR